MGKKIKKKRGEKVPKGEFGVGSSVIQDEDTGKYTFVIHQTRGKPGWMETIQCPGWFDTIEAAKSAGSAALKYFVDSMQEYDDVSARRATESEREEMSDNFMRAFAAIKAAQEEQN